MYNNTFKKGVRRLCERNEANLEKLCIEKHLAHVDHPDYDQLNETLESSDSNSLENCYHKVIRKATKKSNNKICNRDASVTPRSTSVKFELPAESDAM